MSLFDNTLTLPARAVSKLRRVLTHATEDSYRWALQRSVWSVVLNDHEIRIVGMRRSGNHALLTWMRSQVDGEVDILNNVEVNVNPYRYAYEMLRDYHPQHEWALNRLRPFAEGKLTPKNWVFYSYEDHDLAQIASAAFERRHDLYLGKSRKRVDLLILRDPFNMFASRLKSKMISVKNPRRSAVDLWVEYAREYVNETQQLNQTKICVNYNQWVQSRDYRQHLAEQLEIPFSDKGVDFVSQKGGGSSFEGQTFSGKASEMPVLDRWKTFIDDPNYRAFFQDDRLFAYSEKIFGPLPGVEQLKDQT